MKIDSSITIYNGSTLIDYVYQGSTLVYQREQPVVENNKIYYTSTDGNIVTPYSAGTSIFGANIVSNTYSSTGGCITFDGAVTTIGDNAFKNCTFLNSITIPNSVTSIGYYTFASCSSLSNITIPNSVTSIGYYTFVSCSSLSSITIPDSVTSIGESAFKNCTSLSSITIPDSVTSIRYYTFYNCTSLSSITIGSGVTSIKWYAFGNCESLSSITVDTNNTVYDSRNNCNAIIGTSSNRLYVGCYTTIIPSSVFSIRDYAFYGCLRLSSITIPDSVTSIEDFAFIGCTSLSSITIGSGVTSIGYHSFPCSNLNTINYNSTISNWNNISKSSGWNYNVPATVVHCTDGDVSI